jgi:hypothetical protein
VTAIEQLENDGLSSPQFDEADTDSRNEGEIGETTTVTVTFIPALLTPSLPFCSTLFSEVTWDEIYGIKASVDELDESMAQLDPPSDGTDESQLPPSDNSDWRHS